MDKYADLHKKIALFEVLAFSQEIAYGPYEQANGREIVIVRDENGKLTTKTLAKHLMEKHLGRELDKNLETVDHRDSNKHNNSLDNLQVIDRVEHSRQDTRRVRNIKLKCALCGNEFDRSPRLLRDKSKKGNSGPFCSRSCSGKYNRQVQLGKMNKLPVQPHIESEYFKQKYVKSFIDYIFQKYAAHKLLAEDLKKIASQISMDLYNLLLNYASFKNGTVEPPVKFKTEDGKVGYEILVRVSVERKQPFLTDAEYAVIQLLEDNINISFTNEKNFPTEILDAMNLIISKVNDLYWNNELSF